MNRRYLLLVLLSCHFIWLGCASTRQSTLNDSHTSQSSLDWNGTYSGILPCADCEGINTVIQLNADNTYQIAQRYEGRDGNVSKRFGKFVWINHGSGIVLKGGPEMLKFQVGENKLFLLDADGKRITGNLAERYTLSKEANTVTEKYWKLKLLKGASVKTNGAREAFIILKQDGNAFQGHGGCNAITGNYQLSGQNEIRFNNISSTEMACAAINTEQQLIKVLQDADKYMLSGDTLVLKQGEVSLAKFEAVYLH